MDIHIPLALIHGLEIAGLILSGAIGGGAIVVFLINRALVRGVGRASGWF